MSVLVVGGALMDILGHARGPLELRTSNPARFATTPGGVGRNIAENLARLGTPVTLLSVIGPDAHGEAILTGAQEAGIDTRWVLTAPEPTGTYLAVLDVDGELHLALSDLSATEALTVERIRAVAPDVEAAEALVIDANLPVPVITWLLDVAAEASTPVVLEPVSVVKAQRLAPVLTPRRPVWLLTPNADELAALGGSVADLHRAGVANVWVRSGPDGSCWYAEGAPPVAVPSIPTQVVDVTGGGDAATAGVVHAHVAGLDDLAAAAYGQRCGALTVASPRTVRPDLATALLADPT